MVLPSGASSIRTPGGSEMVIFSGLVGSSMPPRTQVTFDGLRAGVSAPEQRERKDGNGTRVVGGKLFYSARAIVPAASGNGRRTFAEAKAE